MKRHWNFAVFLSSSLLMLITAAACGTPLFSHYQTVDPRGWHAEQIISFPAVPDSDMLRQSPHLEENFQLRLHIRFLASSADSLLNLAISYENAASEEITDTLKISLRNPDGSPRGKGLHNLRNLSIPLTTPLPHHSLPITVSISPLSSSPPPRGIQAIGLTLAN